MNIILGFGSTEKEFEKQERKFVEDFINEHKKIEDGWCVFPDEMIEVLRKTLKERRNEYHKLRDSYKEAKEYPDRYSSYYETVLGDLHNIVVVFEFSHINRKHTLSPDGWGLLCSEQVYLFKANN